jgi:DNA-binding FadR family transcriptional regulator
MATLPVSRTRAASPSRRKERKSVSRSKENGKALRLHGKIARRLGIAIVAGKLPPGHLLDGEVSSSEHLDVSRTAYREAVRILAAKGLLDARPKAGTRVNPRERWHLLDPDVLDWMFESRPDEDTLDSLFELRAVVESAAAGLAATRRTETHLGAMRSALERMAKHTLTTEAGRQADLDFHSALLAASQNPFIASMTEGVNAAVRSTTVYKLRNRPLRRDPLPDHLRVFEAIAARDATRAESAMKALIRLARVDTPGGR